jgi:alpha-methylacyl-CoA racemase
MAGPLVGIRVLEFESIGPAPFAGMMLADMGADVLVIDRPASTDLGVERERRDDVMMRGKRSVKVDLKSGQATGPVLDLMARADVLIEGMRPGVMERLGLGPDDALARNPKIVYGRVTGWGQTGPLAARAGHDINYIGLTGILNAIGPKDGPPVPPLNLVGDFGGGGMLLAFGIVCALFETARSGRGQVIDAAMVDGASLLAAMFFGLAKAKHMSESRGENVLDGGAPWYNVYETKDGKYVSVGAIEARFYDELVRRLNVPAVPQHERSRWPEISERFERTFKSKTRDEWIEIFEGCDACVAPVLRWSEAPRHPHSRARNAHITVSGIEEPAPAPRFSRTPGGVLRPPPERGQGGAEALKDWGFGPDQIASMKSRGFGFGD